MSHIAQTAVAHAHPSTLTVNEARTVKRAIKIIEEKRIKAEHILHYKEDFERYLMLLFAGLTNEQKHVFYLDVDKRLLAADVEALGTHKSVGYSYRDIALRAITLGAEYIVLAHNHPNDCQTPSKEDAIGLTQAERVFAPLGVTVLESYVVTSHGITSIKNFRTKQEEIALDERRAMEEQQQREHYERNKESYARGAKKRAATMAAKKAAQEARS